MERLRLDDQFVRQLLPYDINTFVEIVRAQHAANFTSNGLSVV
jgi:hypothetical protein